MTRTAPLLLAALLALGASCKKTNGSAKPEGSASGAPNVSAAPAGQDPATDALANLVGDEERGRLLVVKFECSRCHDGTGVASAPFEKHCFQCHQDIVNDRFSEHFKAPPEKLEKWKKTSLHYLWAPSFENAGARYKREFVQAFVLKPHKVRPVMWSSMPRLALSPQEAVDIATYITRGAPKPGPAPVGGDTTRGRQVLESKACGTCHVMTGVPDLPLKPNPSAADQKRQGRHRDGAGPALHSGAHGSRRRRALDRGPHGSARGHLHAEPEAHGARGQGRSGLHPELAARALRAQADSEAPARARAQGRPSTTSTCSCSASPVGIATPIRTSRGATAAPA